MLFVINKARLPWKKLFWTSRTSPTECHGIMTYHFKIFIAILRVFIINSINFPNINIARPTF